MLLTLTVARARVDDFAVLAVAYGAIVAVTAGTVLNDGLPRERSPLGSNWASPAQYERIAARIPDGATVASPGEIGTLAYYCADRCRVLDWFADRGQLEPMLRERETAAGSLLRTVLALNYARFDPGATPADGPRDPDRVGIARQSLDGRILG